MAHLSHTIMMTVSMQLIIVIPQVLSFDGVALGGYIRYFPRKFDVLHVKSAYGRTYMEHRFPPPFTRVRKRYSLIGVFNSRTHHTLV